MNSDDRKTHRGGSGARGLLLAALLLSVAALTATAQTGSLGPPPLPVDPTPLKELLTAAEKKMLAAERNPRRAVEVYLRISDVHLEAAYKAAGTDDWRGSERELDIYKKIVAEVVRLALSNQQNRRRMAKKIEQRLYAQIKTLELIERMFPIERAPFAQDALKQARQFRVQTLHESLESGEVLHDPAQEKKDSAKSGPQKNPVAAMTLFASALPDRWQTAGDYLTEEEDDFVRQAQRPDERVKVFMKIADRRLTAIAGSQVAADKKAQQKAEEEQLKWGALPKLSRAELLLHYARAINESIAKLEDAHERNPRDSAIPRALKALLESTDRHLATLRSLSAEMKTEAEKDALRVAVSASETANAGAREGLKGK